MMASAVPSAATGHAGHVGVLAAAVPPPRTVVIARKFGQLANRLILFAHWISYAREHGVRILNPSFVEYAPFFRATNRDPWCRYPPREGGDTVAPWVRQCLYQSVYLPVRLLAHLRCTAFPVRVIRLVCSNASWQPAAFAGRDVLMGTGHLVEDLYSLTRCDYLVGPPRTFGGEKLDRPLAVRPPDASSRAASLLGRGSLTQTCPAGLLCFSGSLRPTRFSVS